ncbi:MAG TPA: hypothetical protein VIV58_32810, partial [Kofleriaceae bacterium]
MQCLANVCRARCERAPDCGDGYACTNDGSCVEATGDRGDICTSEAECKPGLACFLSNTTDGPGPLTGSCLDEHSGHIAGASCMFDTDCRDGTCAMGRCIDLCNTTRDCGVGTACTHIPRVDQGGTGRMFAGCLQATGSIVWNIPVTGPFQTVPLAVPESAQSVSIAMRVDDPNQMVGVTHVVDPNGATLVEYSLEPYQSTVRHLPALHQSVLAMPSKPDVTFLAGMYTLAVTSLLPQKDGSLVHGTATPVVTAVAKLDSSVILDLHFYFLDLTDHPCAAAFDNGLLDAKTAATGTTFKSRFISALSSYLAASDVALGSLTYDDISDHPDLDGPALANVDDLLKLGTHAVGINVFFVRSMSPAGVQAFAPNPGPAGLASTSDVGLQSGVIISLDSLCYESWEELARLTTRELARYMGLYNNVEFDGHADPINDNDQMDPTSNLMYFSEAGGGTMLSPGQRKI